MLVVLSSLDFGAAVSTVSRLFMLHDGRPASPPCPPSPRARCVPSLACAAPARAARLARASPPLADGFPQHMRPCTHELPQLPRPCTLHCYGGQRAELQLCPCAVHARGAGRSRRSTEFSEPRCDGPRVEMRCRLPPVCLAAPYVCPCRVSPHPARTACALAASCHSTGHGEDDE